MINKEDFRNLDSLINWGKYAEALEQEVARLDKEVVKLTKALKECCRHSSCRFIKIEDEYCEHEDVVDTCEDCLFNHYMKEVEKDG